MFFYINSIEGQVIEKGEDAKRKEYELECVL